jgi:putative membrane protein
MLRILSTTHFAIPQLEKPPTHGISGYEVRSKMNDGSTLTHVAPGSTEDSPVARRIIAALSVFVVLAVVVVIYVVPKQPTGDAPTALASLNALLNGSATVCLIGGYMAVRQRALVIHRRFMLAALGFSSLFLVSYLVHHITAGSVPFRGEGGWRVVYFSLLIPHVLLAVPVLPLALFTVYRGLTDRRVAHRKIARITLPVWLFVAVSGVLVYFMLYHL